MFEILVNETVPRLLSHLTLVSYPLAFAGGILTSLMPCNLSMIPVIIGYVGGQHEMSRRKACWLSFVFTIGTSLTFVALGVIAGKIGGFFGTRSAVMKYVAAGVCVFIGLHLLKAIQLNFDFITRLQPKRVSHTGTIGSFLLGLVIGVTGSQCVIPILAPLLVFVTVKGSVVYGAVLLFLFALGRGVPVVLAGTYTGALRALPVMERWTPWFERAAGVLIIGVGLFFIATAYQ